MPNITAEDAAYLDSYDPGEFPRVAVTVDVVVMTVREERLHVLLIERDEPPFKGRWALPGGFLRVSPERADMHAAASTRAAEDKDLKDAAIRELAEETGLRLRSGQRRGARARIHLEQLATYGMVGRDPRMRVVTVAYLAVGNGFREPSAGGDARLAAWAPVDAVLPHPPARRHHSDWPLAFDHEQILADALARLRSKIQYTPLALALAEDEFTLGELQDVFEAVDGAPLHSSNFRRRVLSIEGLLERVESGADRPNSRGGPRRQQLFRAGKAAKEYLKLYALS